MPAIRGIPPYRLFFVSFDCHEPKHVHVQRERRVCKYWMEPIVLAGNHGFSPVELNIVRQLLRDNSNLRYWKHGMNIVVPVVEPRIADLRVTESEITAYLVDGRTVSVPLAWSWRLSEATPVQRDHWELIGDGVCVHWPEVDEDISIEAWNARAEADRCLVKQVPIGHGARTPDARRARPAPAPH